MCKRVEIGMVILAALLAAAPLTAQVVRESDVSSVAGVLAGPEAKLYDDFAFTSNGAEILYATVDAAIYQMRGSDHEEHGVLPGAVQDDHGGGCGEGGGVGTCLQLLDASDEVLCWATRPRSPGWQRDPRLVCLLPVILGRPAEYRLRVALSDDDCSDLLYPLPESLEDVPYVLNVSLRRVARPGGLAQAITSSKNRF